MKQNLVVLAALSAAFFSAPAAQAQAYLTDNATATAERAEGRGEIYREESVEPSSSYFDEGAPRTVRDNAALSASAERASSTKSVDGHLTAQAHRGTVTVLVESLLKVAEREERSGLGEQVRAIALAQKNAEATTTDAIERVAFRGPIESVLFGSDYKSLALLKNEIRETEEHLRELRVVSEHTDNTVTRAALETQISALENDRANLQKFITAHQNRFSVFGWLNRLLTGG